ncbi:DUF814 domain-containing protein [Candidatus Woesearchaeota archaeon]|nr:DUF814 domain-containing protein [Candidatus Woesearchaeota archaeon]
MRVTLDIRKTIDENAASYFEKSKHDKKKIEGARKVIEEHRRKLEDFSAREEVKEKNRPKKVAEKQKREWFEKFRWFFSSDGFLVIGGRDAVTNEIVVKKHTDPDDWVFHTDMAGSPFVIIKRKGHAGEVPESTMEEAAQFTAVFSRGWKQGMATLAVFHVKPSQVTKEANAGESLPRGAFMIRGETKYHHPQMNYAVGLKDGKVMGGPIPAVKKHCKEIIEIVQGDSGSKVSDVAKAVKKAIGGDLDDIIRVLPQNCKIKKQKR